MSQICRFYCITICLMLSVTGSFAQKKNEDKGEEEKCTGPLYKLSEVTRKAKIRRADDPRYTKEAWQNDIRGRVLLRLVLCANGKVTNIEVLKGLPFGLTEKAIETTRKMKFRPAEKDGHPVSIIILREFDFHRP